MSLSLQNKFRQNVLLVGHACYMFRQFPAIFISCVNNAWQTQIMKLFPIMQDFPSSKAQTLPPTSSRCHAAQNKTVIVHLWRTLTSHLSPLTISEVCCRPGRSWLVRISPYWSPALARTDGVSSNLSGQATDKG